MRDMPLPFELEGKGGVGFFQKFCRDFSREGGFGVADWSKLCEPTSVLDKKRSPSPCSASTSSLSSSLAGGGSAETAAVATVSGNPPEKWPPGHSRREISTDNSANSCISVEAAGVTEMAKRDEWGNLGLFQQIPANLQFGAGGWDSGLLEPPAAAASQDKSIMRLIMGDMEESMGLSKLLTNPNFYGGGGIADQGFVSDQIGAGLMMNDAINLPQNPIFFSYPPQNPKSQILDSADEKSHVLNQTQLLLNQLQAQNLQNPAFFPPIHHNQPEQNLHLPPPAKRHNNGIQFPPEFGLIQNHNEGLVQNQAVLDQLLEAAELVEAGNPILAHEILARLNHHLSPLGTPFHRVAFYFKEALMNNTVNSSLPASPFDVILRIGAYKSFTEISPLVQFANFTCNQAILESLEGFDHIRIIDFNIGFGGQWASVLQELALRKQGSPSVKITAFASPTTHDQFEISLARENLIEFAQELNMTFEFEIINPEYFNSLSSYQGEAVAVNLPVSSLYNGTLPPTIVLSLIKNLTPKIIVTINRGSDIHQSFHSYLGLLESLDATNPNPETLQKIETFLICPSIEKLIMGRRSSPEKMQHWKNLFVAAGFAPVNHSRFTECQAEWLLRRTMARGFHVEKRQSGLVLCWQRKELISASAWKMVSH